MKQGDRFELQGIGEEKYQKKCVLIVLFTPINVVTLSSKTLMILARLP